jgi:hypothetical protein
MRYTVVKSVNGYISSIYAGLPTYLEWEYIHLGVYKRSPIYIYRKAFLCNNSVDTPIVPIDDALRFQVMTGLNFPLFLLLICIQCFIFLLWEAWSQISAPLTDVGLLPWQPTRP